MTDVTAPTPDFNPEQLVAFETIRASMRRRRRVTTPTHPGATPVAETTPAMEKLDERAAETKRRRLLNSAELQLRVIDLKAENERLRADVARLTLALTGAETAAKRVADPAEPAPS
jgi:hypothetical protein